MNKRDERVAALLKQLEDGILSLKASDCYKDYLKVMSKFYNYSVNNTLLILQQFPTATQIAGYKTWQNKFNRCVMAGETSIKIFSPLIYKDKDADEQSEEFVFRGYKISHVFDVSQTEGDALLSIVKTLDGQGLH